MTPEEINTVLAASGDWNKVIESPSSGDSDVLGSADNIMLNTNLFAGVVFTPQNLTITGNTDGFGPYHISVSLAQACSAAAGIAALHLHQQYEQLHGLPRQLCICISNSDSSLRCRPRPSMTGSLAYSSGCSSASFQHHQVAHEHAHRPALRGAHPQWHSEPMHARSGPLLHDVLQRPTAAVQATVELSERDRGQLSPGQVQWTPSTWQQAQSLTLSVADQAWSSVSSGQFYVVLHLQSRDPAFNGRRPRIRVTATDL